MKCETAIDLVIDSLMDSHDSPPHVELTEHLASCNSCAVEARRMEATWTGLAALPVPPAGDQTGIRFGRRLARQRLENRFRPVLQIAAAIALLLLGGAGGFWLRGPGATVPTVAGDAGSYLLLVRGPDPDTGDPPEVIVGEYVAWANELADRGLLLGGNKLRDEPGRWISGAPVPDPRTASDVSGYFLISAANYEEAIATARNSPHIRYGGTFEIREVDRAN